MLSLWLLTMFARGVMYTLKRVGMSFKGMFSLFGIHKLP